MILLAFENYGMILWIVWIGLWIRSWRFDLGSVAVFLALATASGAWILYYGKSWRGGKGSVTTLGLSSYAVPAESLETPRTSPQPPPVPTKWSTLMSVPRPRDVYWPFWSKLWALTEIGFLLGSVGYVAFVIHGRYVRFAGWKAVWPRNLTWFAFTAIADMFVVANIYAEIGSWRLLRDGEATVGVMVEWIEHRRGLSTAVYRFWTRTGECFERRSPVTSDKDEQSGIGPVLVFYLPEDPTKSIAMCSTQLRVKVPSEELDARMQRLDMKS